MNKNISFEKIKSLSEEFIMPTYRQSLCLEKGKGIYLYSSDGRVFLDFTSGIAVTNLGHCHPEIIDTIYYNYIPLYNAIGLGLRASEKNTGAFKNRIITFETKALNVLFHSWDEKFDINYQPFDNEEFRDKDVFFDEVLKRWRFKYSSTDYDDEQYYNDHLDSVEQLYRKLEREMK